MVLDAALLSSQNYKLRIKGNVKQSKGMDKSPRLHLGLVAIERGAFGSPLTTVANFAYFYFYFHWNIPTKETQYIYIYIYIYIYRFSPIVVSRC